MFSSLTLCSQTEEKRGRGHCDPAEAFSRQPPLDAVAGLTFHGSAEPVIAEHGDMALLSNILAAYSFVSGSCPFLAGPGLSPGWPSLAFYSGEKCYAIIGGLCCAEF